jgi:hypothetical protein
MAEAGGAGADTLETPPITEADAAVKLNKATDLIEALAGWIHEHLGKQGGHSEVFATLAGTKLQGYGMDADADGCGDIHVGGQGYHFDVTQHGETITIDNGGIRLGSYPGRRTLASANATLSLRVLLADALQMHRGPSWTVVVKLTDVAHVTVRGDPPGSDGVGVATVKDVAGRKEVTNTIRWSTLTYLLYGKSFYTLKSDGAFQISEPDAEVDILEACTAVWTTLTVIERRTIEAFYDKPTQWDLNPSILRLRPKLTALNTDLKSILDSCGDVTYNYTAGVSPKTSIHTYFRESQPGAWSHLPTQPLLF